MEFDDRDYYFYLILLCTTSTIGFLDVNFMSTVQINIQRKFRDKYNSIIPT